MTDDEINHAIANKVLGWTLVRLNSGQDRWMDANGTARHFIHSFKPSTDISQAWEVMEIITQPRADDANARFSHWFDRAHLWANTAEMAAGAICKAALAAIEAGPIQKITTPKATP